MKMSLLLSMTDGLIWEWSDRKPAQSTPASFGQVAAIL
jgi:hypothetical protein